MGLAGSGAADEDDVALMSDEAASRQIAHQSLVDRSTGKIEVGKVLCKRQLGNGQLVLDRLLLGNLGLEQVADDLGRSVLALEASADDLVEGHAHAIELEL